MAEVQLEAERTAGAQAHHREPCHPQVAQGRAHGGGELLIGYVEQEKVFTEVDGEDSDDMSWIRSTSNDHEAIGSNGG